MGIIRGGVLGGFRNKAGAVIGSYWRTLDIIKGLPRISGKAATQLQLEQQAKFGLVTQFLGDIGDLVNIGYKGVSKIATPMNEAVSYNLKHAVTGDWPNYNIDFPELKYSSGNLKLPMTIDMETEAGGKLNFTWTTEQDDSRIDATDMVTLMVFDPAKQRFVSRRNVAARSELACSLQLPAEFVGDTVNCYISFNSLKVKNQVSDSYFIGETEII